MKSSLSLLKSKRCAILGFGSQGSAQALNLRDAGLETLIALPSKSKSRLRAHKEGFQVTTTAKAIQQSDLICLALPDLKMPEIFKKEIAPHLRPGMTLLFLHGFVVHYQLIELSQDLNIMMVSPKGGPGPNVRTAFIEKKSIPTAIAIHQDPSHQSKKLALAWAEAIGSSKHDIFFTTFQEETESNLFAEQAVICGGINALIQRGFETLIEAGISPELAYISTLREIKLTTDLIYHSGISGMRAAISETAKYGDLTVGPTIIDASVKKKMHRALKNIQSGAFAKEWIQEHQSGLKNYHALLQQGKQHPIEIANARFQKMSRAKTKVT